MDYSRILNKPFFVTNVNWGNQGASVVLSNLNFPIDFLTNPLVQVPFNTSLYYRAKTSILLQVSGTPMHAGTLIAAAVPVGAGTNVSSPTARLNTLLTSPHVFLHANEATPALLEVPFYVNSKLASITLDGNTPTFTTLTGNYANIVLQVLNQLSTPTTGSATLSVSVHVIFRELEFYVPHVNPTYVAPALAAFDAESGLIETAKGFVTDIFDSFASGAKNVGTTMLDKMKPRFNDAIDMGRGYLKAYTGLHNPADATISSKMSVQSRQYNNQVDAPLQLEKLDPYSQFHHYTRDYTFDTARDEMDLRTILSKPQILGTFNVATVDTSGKLLWSRPITPLQDVRLSSLGAADSDLGVLASRIPCASNIQNLYYMTRYWKGTIKIHIQSVMSNFQFCKLTLARNYSTDVRSLTSVPSFASIPNLMMESVEFSAGGQVQTFELPYCSPMEQLPNVVDYVSNALSHGMYYIYLHQPLVNNGSTTYNARFNVYISMGDDFQLFGYASRPIAMYYAGFNTDLGRTPEDPNNVSDAYIPAIHPPISGPVPVPIDPGGEDSFAAESAEVDVSQKDILFKVTKTDDVPVSDLRPIVSMRDFIRRFQRVWYERYIPSDLSARHNLAVFDVASLLGVRGPQNTFTSAVGTVVVSSTSPLQWAMGMYAGYSGGARFKVNILGSTLAEVWYVPPGFTTQGYSAAEAGHNKNWRGTIPIAFNSSDPLGSGTQGATALFYQFAERDPPAGSLSVGFLSPTVCQERANLTVSSSNLDVSLDNGTQNNRMPMAGSSFEFEIPHMTPYRFVGDASKLKVPVVGTHPDQGGETNMGHIVIKMTSPVIYYPNTPNVLADTAIEIFAAADDVGRMGYHTMAPQTVFPTGAATTATVGAYDGVILTSEATPITTTTANFKPYPYYQLIGGGIPSSHNYSSMYYSA